MFGNSGGHNENEKVRGRVGADCGGGRFLAVLAPDGGEPVGSTPEQFARHLVTEIARWRKVVKEAGIRLE